MRNVYTRPRILVKKDRQRFEIERFIIWRGQQAEILNGPTLLFKRDRKSR